MTTISTMILTDWFKTNYGTTTWDGTQKVKVALYSRSPVFSEDEASRFADIESFSELSAYPEWVPTGATLTSKTAAANSVAITNKALASNVATLTTSAAHGLSSGWSVTISGVDSTFNGTYTITGTPTATTFTYAKTATNVTSTAVSPNGTVSFDFYLKNINVGGTLDGLQIVNNSGTYVSVEDGEGWYFNTDPTQVVVSSAVFYLVGTFGVVTNPVLFASTKGIGQDTVAHYQSLYGQFETGAATGKQYIIGYDTSSQVFLEGYTLLSLSTPIWEGAHAQHVWIQPQRINFIANPSFETTGGAYWRAGRATTGAATIASTAGGITSANPLRQYAGRLQTSGSGSGNIILESNLFPKVNDWYSISFYASGNGSTVNTSKLYFGLVTRPQDASSTAYIRNRTEEPKVLGGGTATSGFKKFTALVQIPDDVSDLMLRIEYSGTTLWVDNVLVDPHESQYEYFDGNSKDGLDGDFRWMGGSSAPYINKHFSLWYNNYANTRARLLGDYDTLDNLYKPGLLEEWSPTGSNITAHWDAVTNVTPLNWIGDAFYPISNLNGTAVSTIDTLLDFNLAEI